MKRALVCGAGGFIGHHLVKRLKAEGHFVRGADLEPSQYEESPADDFRLTDLRTFAACERVCSGIDDVYQLAADMGGIGYISSHHADLARNNSLINLHMLEAARHAAVKRYLFTSSACVYPADAQRTERGGYSPEGLAESDAIPADPERGYGWEKLYAEQLCDYYRQDHGLDVRVVRFHNVYGPLGTYDGGREKAPAALCRKVALSTDGMIDVWGDGQQTRSFLYVDDCVEGVRRIMESGCTTPLNLGSDVMVSVDHLALLVAGAAGKTIAIRHVGGPQGVRGRNSDNSRARNVLGWEPRITLTEGLARTYPWIAGRVIR